MKIDKSKRTPLVYNKHYLCIYITVNDKIMYNMSKVVARVGHQKD